MKYKTKIPYAAIRFAASVGWTGVPSDVEVQTLWSGRTSNGREVDRVSVTIRGGGLAVRGVVYRIQGIVGEYLTYGDRLPMGEDELPLAPTGIPMWRITGWDHPGSLTWREILPATLCGGLAGVHEALDILALGAGWRYCYVGDRRFEFQNVGESNTDSTVWELTDAGYVHFCTTGEEGPEAALCWELKCSRQDLHFPSQ